jgi:hypothetical protein
MVDFIDACVSTDLIIPCNVNVNLQEIKEFADAIMHLDVEDCDEYYTENCKFKVPTMITGNMETITFTEDVEDLGNVILNCKNLKKICLYEATVNIKTKFICPDTLETFESVENQIDSFDLVQFNKGLKSLTIIYSTINNINFIERLTELQELYLTDNRKLTKIVNPWPVMLEELVIEDCPIKNIDEFPLSQSLVKLTLCNFEIKNKFPPIPATLVYLNISCTNTTSLESFPIMHNLKTFIFNENDDRTKHGYNWIANKIDILDLSKFPHVVNLTACVAGIKKIINYENHVFENLEISHNAIEEFKNWKFARVCESICIASNFIKSFDNIQWPRTINNILYITNNPIAYLPLSIIYTNTRRISYNDCPIENLNDPIIRRWLDRNKNKSATIYNNSQNVHDAAIVESVKQSIVSLAKLPQTIKISLYDNLLNKETIHSEYALTEWHVALLVENCIATKEPAIQKELHAILKEAIRESYEGCDGKAFCLTGRIGRIINVLSGFDDCVVIKIGNSEQIANVILAHQKRNAPHEEIIKALKELQLTDEEIDAWVGELRAPPHPPSGGVIEK